MNEPSIDPVLLALLDAHDAQIELLRVQAQGLRHRLLHVPARPTPRLATVELPERCTAVPEDRCALQDPDARRAMGSFAYPHAWHCVGCRHRQLNAPEPSVTRSTGE